MLPAQEYRFNCTNCTKKFFLEQNFKAHQLHYCHLKQSSTRTRERMQNMPSTQNTSRRTMSKTDVSRVEDFKIAILKKKCVCAAAVKVGKELLDALEEDMEATADKMTGFEVLQEAFEQENDGVTSEEFINNLKRMAEVAVLCNTNTMHKLERAFKRELKAVSFVIESIKREKIAFHDAVSAVFNEEEPSVLHPASSNEPAFQTFQTATGLQESRFKWHLEESNSASNIQSNTAESERLLQTRFPSDIVGGQQSISNIPSTISRPTETSPLLRFLLETNSSQGISLQLNTLSLKEPQNRAADFTEEPKDLIESLLNLQNTAEYYTGDPKSLIESLMDLQNTAEDVGEKLKASNDFLFDLQDSAEDFTGQRKSSTESLTDLQNREEDFFVEPKSLVESLVDLPNREEDFAEKTKPSIESPMDLQNRSVDFPEGEKPSLD